MSTIHRKPLHKQGRTRAHTFLLKVPEIKQKDGSGGGGGALLGASARDEATLDPDPGSKSRAESQTWLFDPRPGCQGKEKREPSSGEKSCWRQNLKMLTCELRTILKDKGKIFVRTRPSGAVRRLSDNAQNLGGGHYSF